MIGLPIVEMPVRIMVEGLMFGDSPQGLIRYEAYGITFAATFAVAYLAYRAIDGLVPVQSDKPLN